jgi:hypothetical protein
MEDYPMKATGLIDEMVGRLGEELKQLLGQIEQGGVPARCMEGILRDKLWHLGTQAMGVMLEALDRQCVSDRPVHDHRTRTLVSLFGPLDVARSRCRTPEGWCYPLDEAMGLLGHRGWTVGVHEAVSLLSCEMSFESVGEVLDRLFGLSVSAPMVQWLAECAGRGAEALLEAPPERPPRKLEVPDTLVVAVDGCKAPQRDGWREVKVATLYGQQGRCRSATGRGKLLRKEYFATLENAECFGQCLWARARHWGVEQARRVVVMGDGAPWIWNLAVMHYPGAIEIVDFYHAVEHLWDVGEALWGDRHTSAATRSWVGRYRKRLKQGRVDLVVAAIDRSRSQRGGKLSSEQANSVRLQLGYFRENASRMRYGRFRQMRLAIGTGAVEGACKHVVQARFKRPGMRWSRPGLKSMLALRLIRLNNRWEQLWPHLKVA